MQLPVTFVPEAMLKPQMLSQVLFLSLSIQKQTTHNWFNAISDIHSFSFPNSHRERREKNTHKTCKNLLLLLHGPLDEFTRVKST